PSMDRLISTPIVGEQQMAQGFITNQYDWSQAPQPATIPTILKANPKITTWTGSEPPYGYVDWFPSSLYVNNTVKPFDDPDVRWALSYYLDRSVLVEVGWSGASSPSAVPWPSYPALKPFTEAIQDLLQQYPTNEFNPSKGDAVHQKKGWTKQGGVWKDAQGTQLKLDILGLPSNAAVGPVIVELLKRQGIEATFAMPPDSDDRFFKGDYTGKIY